MMICPLGLRVHAKSLQSCPTLWHSGLPSARLLCPWGVSRQEHWNGLPCPPPRDILDPRIKPCPPPGYLSNPEIESTSLISPALAGSFFTASTTWEALPWDDVMKMVLYLCDLPPPNTRLKKEPSVKSQLRDILQNTWLVLLRTTKVIKNKESLRNCDS